MKKVYEVLRQKELEVVPTSPFSKRMLSLRASCSLPIRPPLRKAEPGINLSHRLLRPLERRPRHSHPERSQGGVRKGAVISVFLLTYPMTTPNMVPHGRDPST